jgi:hypothetical protein
MIPFRTAAAAVVSTVALSGLAVSIAPTADAAPSSEPCARQQAHVDRATAKLAALTEKFAAHPTTKNKKAKKAQVQRVAHATARLDSCLAAQPAG